MGRKETDYILCFLLCSVVFFFFPYLFVLFCFNVLLSTVVISHLEEDAV